MPLGTKQGQTRGPCCFSQGEGEGLRGTRKSPGLPSAQLLGSVGAEQGSGGVGWGRGDLQGAKEGSRSRAADPPAEPVTTLLWPEGQGLSAPCLAASAAGRASARRGGRAERGQVSANRAHRQREGQSGLSLCKWGLRRC